MTIEAGHEALARRAWEEARSAFEHALQACDRAAARDSSSTVFDLDEIAEVLFELGAAL